jgi:hypothetical protein
MHMTHQQFLNYYLGNRIDFDGGFGYQCTDLARAYVQWVWGKSTTIYGGNGGAVEAYRRFPDAIGQGGYAEKIANNPFDVNQVPKQGDIIVFDATSWNPYGHISIVDSAPNGVNYFVSIDQNAGSGTGDGVGLNAIRKVSHSYTGSGGFGRVLGWLRLSGSGGGTPTPPPNNNQEMPNLSGALFRQAYINAWNNNDRNWLLGSLVDRDRSITEMQDRLEALAQDKTYVPIIHDQSNQSIGGINLNGAFFKQNYINAWNNHDRYWLLGSLVDRDKTLTELQQRYQMLLQFKQTSGSMSVTGTYTPSRTTDDPTPADPTDLYPSVPTPPEGEPNTVPIPPADAPGQFKPRSEKLKVVLGFIKNTLPSLGVLLVAFGFGQENVNQVISIACAFLAFIIALILEWDKTIYQTKEQHLETIKS